MVNIGARRRVPKQNNIKQWEKLRNRHYAWRRRQHERTHLLPKSLYMFIKGKWNHS